MKAFEMFSVVFIAFLIFQESFATVPVNGTCDTKCALNGTTVNLTDYLGIWFLQQYVPNGPNDATKCTYLNISAIEENTIVASTHFITHPGNVRKVSKSNIERDETGKFSFLFTDFQVPIPSTILSSSKDYLVTYLCAECGFFSKEGAGLYAYVYTRLHQPPCGHTVQPILDLRECSIPAEDMKAHNQWDCQIC